MSWTYSQLDRVLRPLRSRCNALATYSGRSLASLDDLPPSLSILPPPDTVGIRIRLDKQHVKTLDLSRKLYAVRDCFRTFLAKVLANPHPPPDRVIALADLCATIVGTRLLDVESDHPTELFEAIPSQYQRKAVVAHALVLVLQLCPHNPTLLLLLLESTLAFRLANESNTLLQAILTTACCPDATSCPPLCHPNHQTFLVGLCDRWTSSGQPIMAFAGILLTVVRTAGVASLWACEAMNTFLIKLAQDDFTIYMSCLSQMLSRFNLPSTNPGLYSALRLWLTTACAILLTNKDDRGVDHIPVLLYHIALFIESNSQSDKSDDMAVLEEINNVSICLATHWLTTRNQLESARYQLRRIEHFLSAQKTPVSTTFNALVIPIVTSGDLQLVKDKIQENARVLRSRSWLQYEASLLACTLRQVESEKFEQILSTSAGNKAVRDFRFRLIDLVEDAEKRCFGNECRSTITTSTHGLKRMLDDDAEEWDWDPMFSCWHRKQDRKRPRTNIESRPSCSRLHSSPVCYESDGVEQLEAFDTLVYRAALKRVVLHGEERKDCPPATAADPESDDILCSFYHDHD